MHRQTRTRNAKGYTPHLRPIPREKKQDENELTSTLWWVIAWKKGSPADPILYLQDLIAPHKWRDPLAKIEPVEIPRDFKEEIDYEDKLDWVLVNIVAKRDAIDSIKGGYTYNEQKQLILIASPYPSKNYSNRTDEDGRPLDANCRPTELEEDEWYQFHYTLSYLAGLPTEVE